MKDDEFSNKLLIFFQFYVEEQATYSILKSTFAFDVL